MALLYLSSSRRLYYSSKKCGSRDLLNGFTLLRSAEAGGERALPAASLSARRQGNTVAAKRSQAT